MSSPPFGRIDLASSVRKRYARLFKTISKVNRSVYESSRANCVLVALLRIVRFDGLQLIPCQGIKRRAAAMRGAINEP